MCNVRQTGCRRGSASVTSHIAHRTSHISGFTLVEIMIVVVILGILAALVVPQFSNAARTSNENVLKEDLRFLRSQVLIYQAQHGGVAPGYPNGDTSAAPDGDTFIAQLTHPTSRDGAVGTVSNASYPLGPYLRRIPDNPINALSTVRVAAAPGSFPSEAAGTHGWVYDPTTLKLASDATGTDGEGTAYFNY
ncbi:MAG: type II secretion system protein [Phycisphaerales bacterium]